MTNQEMTLADIIQAVVESDFQDDFCLYGHDGPLLKDGLYLMAAYPEVVDDRDVYPQEVTDKGYSLLYYGQAFADVLILALEQKPNASIPELIQALTYYDQNDSFLDLMQ